MCRSISFMAKQQIYSPVCQYANCLHPLDKQNINLAKKSIFHSDHCEMLPLFDYTFYFSHTHRGSDP